MSLLVVGAGPFGLAVAAEARRRGLDHVVLGRPMDFWKSHMPVGMILRSGVGWHLDPGDEHTIEAFLATRGVDPAEAEPITLERYLDYTSWFQEQQGIAVRDERVERLDHDGAGFVATLASGETVAADQVVLALGFDAFRNTPVDLVARLPEGRWAHTCDVVDLRGYAGRRVLVVGGRQSAFETTALLREAGAAAVHVCYRHPTPAFTQADWSWFEARIAEMEEDPGWFRRLPAEEQVAVNQRFWTEGRLKLEPWLAPRIDHPSVALRPGTEVSEVRTDGFSGPMEVTLTDGTLLTVDDVVLATGYRVDMARVDLLARGNLADRVATRGGWPVLTDHFGTSVDGLYVTSMPAVADFGLFMGFTISARVSARIIGRALAG